MRIVFDCSGINDKREVLVKEDNFVLEDYWIDVWFCDGCNIYYDKKEIKCLIFCR